MTDEQTFEQAILQSWSEEDGAKSFVLFSSPNCAPCGRVKAALERLENAGVLRQPVSYINVYHAAAAAMKTQVRSVPVLVRFEHGRETARLTGDQTEPKLLDFLNA
jgi:thioredoxin-like negative regulator of GroEL